MKETSQVTTGETERAAMHDFQRLLYQYNLTAESVEVISMAHKEKLEQAVAGAYAAAAKHFPIFHADGSSRGYFTCHECSWDSRQGHAIGWEAHILALTPADARHGRCQGCGGPHPFDTSVPSEKWNAVIRAKNLPEFLCLTCIVREFVKAGQDFTAELWGDVFDGAPISIAIGSQAAAIASAEARAREYLNIIAAMWPEYHSCHQNTPPHVGTCKEHCSDRICMAARTPDSTPNVETILSNIDKRILRLHRHKFGNWPYEMVKLDEVLMVVRTPDSTKEPE